MSNLEESPKKSFTPIPPPLQDLLSHHAIPSLKPIQTAAINHGLFSPHNLLVCSPSGSGKTLIGLLAIANHLLAHAGTALFIVPYRALANEKSTEFQKFFDPHHLKVKTLTGDTAEDDQSLTGVDLVITTYEKCDTLLRQKHPFLTSLAAIVFDEIHEISTPSRGPRIELLLIRLLIAHPDTQYIFLSATIGNEQTFCDWLNEIGPKVTLVHSDDRPIPLNYEIHLYENKITHIRQQIIPRLEHHQQIIIFVNRRKDCISLAQELQKTIIPFLNQDNLNQCEKGYRALIRSKSYAKPLKDLIKGGVAYHNASLRASDREIVEQLFIHRHVKVLIATTTLAAGINTPANTVIITDIIQYRKIKDFTNEELQDPTTVIFPNKAGIYRPLSPNQLFQMLGRAGRLGFGDAKSGGDAVIMARDKDEYAFALYHYFQPRATIDVPFSPKYKDLESHLYGKQNMEELVLLLLSDRSPCSLYDIRYVLEKSFYWYLYQHPAIKSSKYPAKKIHPDLDLNHIFQISSLTYPLLVETYGRATSSKPNLIPTHVTITKDTTYEVRFTIIYPRSQYHGILHDQRGFHCSCQTTMRLELFKPIHEQTTPYFCRHLSDFFRWCADQPTSGIAQRVIYMVHRSVKHFNVITALLQEHYIAQHAWEEQYSLSTLGTLAVKLYLYPKELTWIRMAVRDYGFTTVTFQVQQCVEFYCLRGRYHPDTLVPLIEAYIDEYTVDYLKQQFPTLGGGDVFSIVNEMARITGLFHRVAMFEGRLETARKFEILGYRIKHGVKSELIDLMENYPNLSRNKARILFEGGITSSRTFSDLGIHEIQAKTDLNLTQIVDMKNPVKVGPTQTTIKSFFPKVILNSEPKL